MGECDNYIAPVLALGVTQFLGKFHGDFNHIPILKIGWPRCDRRDPIPIEED